MKVLHFIETLGCGGAEQLLVTLLPELQRLGVGAEVAVLRPPLDLKKDLEDAGIRVTVLPPHHKWNLPAHASNISRVAANVSADIIHAHLYFPTVCTALAKTTGKTEAGTCTTIHNLGYGGANRRTIKLAARRWIERQLVPRGIDSVFAVSGAVAKLYQTALDVGQVDIHHNPINLAHVRQFASPDIEPRQKRLITIPGRLVHEKGHVDFLEALQNLPAGDLEQLDVQFAGDGPMRPELEAEIERRDLLGIVRILGALPHEVMLGEMAKSDLVVVPSRFEGFGLVALEALALGSPIIATTSGGLPEVIEQAGLLVEPGRPDQLSEAIARLINDDALRAELSTRASARADQGFDVESAALRLIASYEKMLPAKDRSAQGG